MPTEAEQSLEVLLREHRDAILEEWIARLADAGQLRDGRIKEAELKAQCQGFLDALIEAAKSGSNDIRSEAYADVRDQLERASRVRAFQSFSPRDTALFVFSLKQPLFRRLRERATTDAKTDDVIWTANLLLDDLGLYTTEIFQQSREEVINRQNLEIAELATPVVLLWDGIIAGPLIGTLDSVRTQAVMESLLNAIVEHEAEIAIIDITGVPTVDTLVAQHLLKTVAATRLMGADCIISGIRPQIAQTMVHLGVNLDVATKPRWRMLSDLLSSALAEQSRKYRWPLLPALNHLVLVTHDGSCSDPQGASCASRLYPGRHA